MILLSYILGVCAVVMLFIFSGGLFSCWIGFEISTMLLAFFFFNGSTKFNVEMFIKYYLFQASLSLLFLMAGNPFFYNSCGLISSVLIAKMGLAPFQSWFIWVSTGLKMNILFLMLSAQKILPFLILFTSSTMMNLQFFGVINLIMGALCTCSAQDFKHYLIFSSMTSNGVFMILGGVNIEMSLLLMFLYFLSMTPLFINMMSISKSVCSTPHPFYFFIFLVLDSGLPPFTSFMMKMVAVSVVGGQEFVLAMIMMMLAIISMTGSLNLIVMMNVVLKSSMRLKFIFSNKEPLIFVLLLILSLFIPVVLLI